MKRRQQGLDSDAAASHHADRAPELAHGALEVSPGDAASDELPLTAKLTLNHLQAARLLGVSNTTFWELRRAGLLDACKSPIPNRWSRLALEAWSIHGYVPSNLHLRKVG